MMRLLRRIMDTGTPTVMAGLDPAIDARKSEGQLAGSGPAMTVGGWYYTAASTASPS
jgi:hypothetical protein